MLCTNKIPASENSSGPSDTPHYKPHTPADSHQPTSEKIALCKTTYTNFLCSYKDTLKCNDTKQAALVPFPLFIQLCVQASHITDPQRQAVAQLLKKIETGTISLEPTVKMTNKDLKHRLLASIPINVQQRSLVNRKSVELIFSRYKTELGNTIELKAKRHDFESNKVHHIGIAQEFRKLISGNIKAVEYIDQHITQLSNKSA